MKSINTIPNVTQFIHELTWADLPAQVRQQARRCLLDTLGAAIGGRQTALSGIIHDFVVSVYGGQGAYLWLDGREVSAPGAALANGMTIDSLDIHDGYVLVKGHAGAALIPAALATPGLNPTTIMTGQELLTMLVVGYELALRAGLALHATACDYHTSGAWNALGCAAMTARRLGLKTDQTRHALGIAEYHGPRSQMMRCIDHPTMLKDGSGWGAMTGVSAAQLAYRGFTGAPALTVEAPDVVDIWHDLGQNWLMMDQYFKPDAVCRWAQPAIAGALALRQKHNFDLEAVQQIRVFTFHEATRLNCHLPQTTEEAQYSLPFPVAAALVYGELGPTQLSGSALQEARVLALSRRVELLEEAAFNARFPARRYARVEITTTAGEILDSGEVEARWDAAIPPTDFELRQKFRWLAHTLLSEADTTQLEAMIWECSTLPDIEPMVLLLATAQQITD